jgi:hypothetical protein
MSNETTDEIAWECIYSSNNEEEARKIDFLLSQNGYESKFTIKSSDTLFGINAFSGDTELLMGTFSVYCDSAVIDEAFALLENVVSHGEHDSIQQSSPAEYEEELDQTEPKIPIEVKLNFSKAILFSFFPFMGFGTITAVRYATKIPEEYGWRKMVALVLPPFYYFSIFLSLLILGSSDPVYHLSLLYFVAINIAVIGFYFFLENPAQNCHPFRNKPAG